MANSKSRKENKRNSEFSGYSNNQTTELSVSEERIQSATLVRQMQKPKKQLLLQSTTCNSFSSSSVHSANCSTNLKRS